MMFFLTFKRCGNTECIHVRLNVAHLGRNQFVVKLKTKLEWMITRNFSLFIKFVVDISARPPSIEDLKKRYMPPEDVVRQRVNDAIKAELESIPVPKLLQMSEAQRQKLIVDTTERVVRDVTNEALDTIARKAGPEVQAKLTLPQLKQWDSWVIKRQFVSSRRV